MPAVHVGKVLPMHRFLFSCLVFCSLVSALSAQNLDDSLSNKYHYNQDYDYSTDTAAYLPFQPDSLLKHAVCYIGTAYLPNGKAPGGFDCSGFTFYNFKRYGVYLPYYSFQQAEVGRPVPIAEAKRGDLVIFKGHDLAADKAGHVGIVAEVKNGRIKFIHASTSHGVRYDFTDGAYFKERFMGIRRVVE